MKNNRIKKDTLEIEIFRKMDGMELYPPTDTDVSNYIFLTSMKEEAFEQYFKELRETNVTLKILDKSTYKKLSVKLSKKLLVYLTKINDDNIGKCKIYAYYLQYYAKRKNIKEISLEYFAMTIFPRGLFKEKELQKIWEMQKYNNMNLLDHAVAAMSIQF